MNVISILNRTPARVAARLNAGGRATRALKPLVDALLPDETQPVTVRAGAAAGTRLVIDLRREKFYWTGSHEPAVQAVLVDRLSKGMTFWDIGAHVGFFSLLAAHLVGPEGVVHAFEPIAANRSRLEKGVSLNRLPNVVVHEEAVGAEVGQIEFYGHASSLMGSTVRGTEADEAILVRQTSLDDLHSRLPAPSLIKVDAEGAELEIISGGARLLAESRPEVLVECHSETHLATLSSAFANYSATSIDPRHWLFAPCA